MVNGRWSMVNVGHLACRKIPHIRKEDYTTEDTEKNVWGYGSVGVRRWKFDLSHTVFFALVRFCVR